MAPPERYPGEHLDLLGHVPPFAERVLIAGPGATLIGGLLKRKGRAWVGAVVPPEENLAVAAKLLDAAYTHLPPGIAVDAIMVTTPAMVRDVAKALAPVGMLLALVNDGAPVPAPVGLVERHRWPETNRPAQRQLIAWVHANYDGLVHAMQLTRGGACEAAYWVLENIPPACITSAEQHVAIHLEKQRITLALLEEGGARHPLSCFYHGQHAFYKITEVAPQLRDAFAYQARAWEAIGNPVMARRLLRTHEFAHGKAAALPAPISFPGALVASPATWAPSPGARMPRVLLLVNGRMHYGVDVLYDGLVRVLGTENVVDFPTKPSLHGRVEPRFANYPCVLDWPDPAVPASWESVTAEVAAGDFDAILLGDCECTLPQTELRALMAAHGDTPVYIIDAVDEPFDLRATVCAHAGVEVLAGYFKREMLACWDYGPGVWPMPFAYPEARVVPMTGTPRMQPLFWAGHRGAGLRNVYLDFIEKRFGLRFEGSYPQEEYARRLESSLMGLNGFGYGYDTVRYWELPAHGCMLLSERLPICVPDDFVDGVSAVFFDDLPELEAKLDHYLRHQEEAARIAAAGHTHLMQFHTSTARARQVLGVILGR